MSTPEESVTLETSIFDPKDRQPTPEEFSELRRKFLEEVRLRGGAATLPGCPPDITIEKLKQAWPLFRECMRNARRVLRQKDLPPGLDLEDGIMVMREFEKLVRQSLRWLKRVERSIAKAAYDKLRAPGRAARDKERLGRSGSLIARRGAETVAEFEKRLEAQRESRASYDKRRSGRPSGHRISDRPVGGHFVIIDSEGVVLKEENIPATRTRGKETRLLQRTCLWMAGGVEGYENQSLEDEGGLTTRRCDFGARRSASRCGTRTRSTARSIRRTGNASCRGLTTRRCDFGTRRRGRRSARRCGTRTRF
jgi:hypothetical protein